MSSDSDWIRITSRDGFSFLAKRNVVNASGTLKNMLDTESSFQEGISKVCPIDERPIIVEKLVEYMAFKAYYQKAGPKEDVPAQEIIERIPLELVLELLLAADYQDM
ncbi:POZ domain-containing protein [Pleurotus eryngii]|uniref:Elongin-C n=1 Tax=Pleurotus eryngii TaxID=5323 RepID=A0A9P6A387_PLEER|nr:POZ domain-containing protein [Pleurotus eryngii]